jgi:translation initiation factor 2 subunit 3
MKEPNTMKQSVLNIGTLGHIDHGKTSLTRAITGVWTDRHSESIKRNMTIKLGYADAIIKVCRKCNEYTVGDSCKQCGGKAEPHMRISMLDAPGHETLMATAIAGSSVIDAILFVIAANEQCPMQQTKEHLMIISVLGIKNVIIVQTKIDIVGREAAIEHYKQIKAFVKGTIIESAPIIPMMPNLGINLDVLLGKIVAIPVPERDTTSDPLMYVVRSFDVNKPGSDATKLVGGVIGGAILKGTIRSDDKIEIRPGFKNEKLKKEVYEPILTVIRGISNGTDQLSEATPGGLIALSTEIDPSFTKADSLVGNAVGLVGKLPPVISRISMKYHKLARDDVPEQRIAENESLILGIATATALGYVKSARKDTLDIELKRPLSISTGIKIAVMRNIAHRWRLTGYGQIP